MSGDTGSTPVRDPGGPVNTRDEVLAAIRTAPTPPTVDEIARSLDLHPNSVRLHAAALRDGGLITQDSRPGGGRGRPQTTYRTSARGAWTGRRDYQLLASLLLSELPGSDDDRAATARRMGRAWGRRIAADRPAPDARDRVMTALDELGFEPTAGDPAAARSPEDELELRNCPFRELVDPHDGVVCAIHAGMLDGLTVDGETTVDLLSFTSPQACTVRMRARRPDPG